MRQVIGQMFKQGNMSMPENAHDGKKIFFSSKIRDPNFVLNEVLPVHYFNQHISI
jgi:hypothetical protein